MCRDALLSRAARALHSAPHGAYCFVAMFVDMVTILTSTVTQGMYFMDMLVDTVRDEIAECSEKAYPSIGAKELQCLLMMTTESQLSEFSDGRGWNIDNGPSPSVVACDSHDSHTPALVVSHHPSSASYHRNHPGVVTFASTAVEPAPKVPSTQLIQQTLAYAKELERIV